MISIYNLSKTTLIYFITTQIIVLVYRKDYLNQSILFLNI